MDRVKGLYILCSFLFVEDCSFERENNAGDQGEPQVKIRKHDFPFANREIRSCYPVLSVYRSVPSFFVERLPKLSSIDISFCFLTFERKIVD